MVARMYKAVEGAKFPAGLKGQAKIVAEALLQDKAPKLAVDINKVTGPKFVTRQDTLRVTLYYLLVFKSQGLVEAVEQKGQDYPDPAAEQQQDVVDLGAGI